VTRSPPDETVGCVCSARVVVSRPALLNNEDWLNRGSAARLSPNPWCSMDSWFHSPSTGRARIAAGLEDDDDAGGMCERKHGRIFTQRRRFASYPCQWSDRKGRCYPRTDSDAVIRINCVSIHRMNTLRIQRKKEREKVELSLELIFISFFYSLS